MSTPIYPTNLAICTLAHFRPLHCTAPHRTALHRKSTPPPLCASTAKVRESDGTEISGLEKAVCLQAVRWVLGSITAILTEIILTHIRVDCRLKGESSGAVLLLCIQSPSCTSLLLSCPQPAADLLTGLPFSGFVSEGCLYGIKFYVGVQMFPCAHLCCSSWPQPIVWDSVSAMNYRTLCGLDTGVCSVRGGWGAGGQSWL